MLHGRQSAKSKWRETGISRSKNVAVLGGGLAGVSAALALAEAGLGVDLFEQSRTLGGRASSFVNPRLGVPVDLGQHVLLGCCTNLLDFYDRIGAAELITFLDSIAFAADGKMSTLKASRLPEPLHLLPSLVALRQLRLSDKLRLIRLLRHSNPVDVPDIQVDQWLSGMGQSDEAIGSFWGPILVGALNDTLDRASARYAALVIRQAMLLNREGFKLGIPNAPLSVLHDQLPRRALEKLGVRIHTGKRVSKSQWATNGAHTIEFADGGTFEADYIIHAMGPESLLRVPADSTDFSQSEPVHVPIVTLYLWYKGRISIPRALCVAGEHFHWCFDRSNLGPQPPDMVTGLSLVASAARQLAPLSREEICAIGMAELSSGLGINLDTPDHWMVVQHNKATFSPTAAYDKLRLSQKTSFDGIFVAGDSTDTGWPGTMESAVRSGYICAREILATEGNDCPVPIGDLQPRGLAALLFK